MATKIRQSSLDNSVITGHTELSATAANNDVLLVYDTDAGVIKKIQRSKLTLQAPTFTSVSPTNALSGDGTGNHTFTITGTNFTVGSTASLINTSGGAVSFDTVTRNSATQITGVIAKSSLPDSGEPYDVKIVNGENLQVISENQINVNASPVFVTAAGSLGSVADNARTGLRFTVVATDPESAGNVTFELQSGSLPTGLSLSNEGSEGGTAVISGTATAVSPGATVTSNFTLRAVDAASNTTSRAFSIAVAGPPIATFTSSGTFAVPSGTSTLDAVLVVAGGGGGGDQHGGGGGAGGLIYMPNYPVTPGGTITVTVGSGGGGANDGGGSGARGCSGQDSVFGASPSPGLGTGGVLTAKGGGGAGGFCGNGPGLSGGSGGGGGSHGGTKPGGSAQQPTQPGNSGAYGFGNSGGQGGTGGGQQAGGGGGGAGASGSNNSPSPNGGNGGVGKAYTIADGTTPVYYAGGGGGGSHQNPSPPGIGGDGGQGGGGQGGYNACTQSGQDGTANRGGGGGGSGNGGAQGGAGGKGVVIVSYS